MGREEQLEIQVGKALELDKWGATGRAGCLGAASASFHGVFSRSLGFDTVRRQAMGAQARAEVGERRAGNNQQIKGEECRVGGKGGS